MVRLSTALSMKEMGFGSRGGWGAWFRAMKRYVFVVVLIVCDINIFMILLLNQSS